MARNSKSMVPMGGKSKNQVAMRGNSDFGWAGDDFAQMAQRQHQMHDGMSNMMSNFGMPSMKSMMMRDPFADDPFFSGGGGGGGGLFGQMDNMMKDMKKQMHSGMGGHDMMLPQGGNGGGRFMKQTTSTTTKIGPDGRPMKESYQTKAQGAFGGKNKVVERHQMYSNDNTGLRKVAHERMLNDKGRKVVNESGGPQGPTQSYDHYRGFGPQGSEQFDSAWEDAAQRMGMGGSQNRLGYGGGQRQQSDNRRSYGYDDSRHGAYLPVGANAPHQQVRRSNQETYGNHNRDRQGRDIQPTQPQGPSNGLPMPASMQAPPQRAAALPYEGANRVAAPQRARAPQPARQAYQAPRAQGKQPARAG